jgi:CheY-like chemotaxis protein
MSASDATTAVVAKPNASGTILLVEDEDAVRALARRVLERAGYTVLEAVNGVDGARVAEGYTGPIDLLLTDMVMPSLSGRALAERLRARRPMLPVLFMSGYPEGELERSDLTGDGASYLEKPFSPPILRESVRLALEASRGSA